MKLVEGQRRAQVEIALSIDEDDLISSVETGRLWISMALESFTGELGNIVRTAAAEEIDWMNFAPSRIRACVTMKTGPDHELLETYSEAGLQQIMQGMQGFPEYVGVEAVTNTEEGYRGLPQFDIGVVRADGDKSRWLQLSSSVATSVTNEPDGDLAVLAVLREVAERSNPSSASIYWFNGGGPPLERALKSDRWETVPRSRRVLRDYGWLTVLPQELGDRLGGVAALRDSGAFHEVAPLAAGGYWLLATPRWVDYRIEQAERLFEVFAPILPPGKPDARRAEPNVIVERDASIFGG